MKTEDEVRALHKKVSKVKDKSHRGSNQWHKYDGAKEALEAVLGEGEFLERNTDYTLNNA